MNGRDSELFQLLLAQVAQGAWVSLGKVPNPISGKIERNLEVARLSIDMLAALESRTRGNLSEAEKGILDRALRDLRLNFVDEQKKEALAAGQTAQASQTPQTSRATDAPPDSETKG